LSACAVIVWDAGCRDERVVEADDPPVEVDHHEEGRRRVHDVADEIPFAFELRQASVQLGLEPVALERETSSGRDTLEEIGVCEHRPIVDQRRELSVHFAFDHGRDTQLTAGGERERTTVHIDVPVSVSSPQDELQRRVSQRPAQPILGLAIAGRLAYAD
jgi:hypothetical protein